MNDDLYTIIVLVFMGTLIVAWLWLVITEHYFWKGYKHGKRTAENSIKAGERVAN